MQKEYVERLLTELREKSRPEQKKAVREVMKELFGVSSINDDDDSMMRSFQSYSQNAINDLEKFEIMYNSQHLPGKKTVVTGKNLLRAVIQMESPISFFKKIYSDKDIYFDFADHYEPVKAFFAGEQKTIFERALRLMKIYDESKTFIVDEKVEEYVGAIKAILNKDAPYSDIPKLPELLDLFKDAYMKVLSGMEAPIIAAIADARTRVFEVLDTKSYKVEFSDRFIKLFKEIHDKATHCNNVATLQNIKVEADALKVRLLNEMDKKDELIMPQSVADEKGEYVAGGKIVGPQPKMKKKKNISIKSICVSSSWRIETAEDVEKYIAALKKRILSELNEDTIISIEF